MPLYDVATPSYQSLNEQNSLDCVVQNFLCYLRSQGNNETKILGGKIGNRTSVVPKLSSSIHSYLNYRKHIHNKLTEINANVSTMIIDSFRGIDSICLKVRQCISENEDILRKKPIFIETSCEFKTETRSQSLESIESLTKQIEEVNANRNEDYPTQRPKNKLTAAKLARKLKKRNSLLKELRKTIMDDINNDDYEMMEKIVENINGEIESFTVDAEIGTEMIDNTQTESDEETYKKLEQKETQTEIEIFTVKPSYELLTKSNSTLTLKCSKTLAIQTDTFSEEKLDFLMMEKSPLCEDPSLIPDVYSRPAITDINKKMITQLEANDSYLSFQVLMGKNRTQKQKFLKHPKPDRFDGTSSVSFTYGNDTISRRSSIESCKSQRKAPKRTTKRSTRRGKDQSLSSLQSISKKSVVSTTKSVSKRTISPTSFSRSSLSKKSLSKRSMLNNSISKRSMSKNSVLRKPLSKTQSLVPSDEGGNRWKKIYMKPDLRAKYSDSLWFSERYMMKVKNDTKTERGNTGKTEREKVRRRPSRRQVEKRRPKTHHAPSPKNSLASFRSESPAIRRCASGCSCHMTIINDLPSQSNTKCRLRWMRAKNEQTQDRQIEFLDILDDLTPRDLLPLSSEYPRKDIEPKNVQDTYLYKLLYMTSQDNGIWNHLLQPSIKCPDENCTKCRQKFGKDENRKKDRTGRTKAFSRDMVLEKLAPHIQKPPNDKRYFQFVTILPVRVFYDRFQTNEKSWNQKGVKSTPVHNIKLPLMPMKEAKVVDRAKWSSPGSSKPLKVVYDSIQKKEITTNAITPANKLSMNSPRHQEEKTTDKKKSKSCSPRGFESYCSTENPKKFSKQHSYISANKKLDKYIRIQSDIDKKSKDFQEKTPTGVDKKVWAHKYGKGVGQQLVSFIKNQPHPPKLPPPKYAVASKNRDNTSRENISNLRVVMKPSVKHKQVLAHLQGLKEKNDEIQNNIQKAINVIEAKMIDILSAPGDSSSVEAFDVMEKEITNVLSLMKFNSRGSSRKSTAKNGDSAKRTDRLESDFNSISDQLFKKLERILDSEKSKGVTSASDSDKKSRNKKEQDNVHKKHTPLSPKRNTAADKYWSQSATSTSLDENVQNSGNVSRRPNYNKGRMAKKTKTSRDTPPVTTKKDIMDNSNEEFLVQKLSIEEDTINMIEREYATGESFGFDGKIKLAKKQTLTSQDCDDTDNSRGDCIKQDILKNTEYILSNLDINDETDAILIDYDDAKVDLKENILETDSKEQIVEETDNKAVSNDDESPIVIEEAEILVEADEKLDELLENRDDKPTTKTEPEESPNQAEKHESPIMLPDVVNSETEESDIGFSGEVNKIIKRVEDIYCHLDDIQFSNDDNIPVFRDSDQVPNVHSQEFLTPFMQAVKDKRNRPDSPTKEALQRSPSYYNVLSFLDTLSDIQEEKPIEVHTAWLYNYCYLYNVPEIFHQTKLEYPAILKEVEKPSCLKKNSDEGKSKHKKVSFLVMKENKSCQVAICPFHNTKPLKVSSQQLPPIPICTTPGEVCENTESTAKIFSEPKVVDNKDQLGLVEKNIIVLCDRRHQSDHSSEMNRHSSEINQVSEITNSIKDICEMTKSNDIFEIDKSTQVYCQTQTEQKEEPNSENINDICEMTKSNDIFEIEKSTQVYCQTQTEQKEKPNWENINESNLPLLKYCEKSQQVSEVSEDSKSSASSIFDSTPQINVFYNQSDAAIPKLILKNHLTGEYGHESILQVKNATLSEFKPHPKIVVFREVLDTKGILKPLKNLDTNFLGKELEKDKRLRLPSRKSSKQLVESNPTYDERVMLLKSFYALIYILMFTALNLEYRCP